MRYGEQTFAIWRHYCHHRDILSRDALVKIYLPFARMVAAKVFAKRVDEEISFDDYHQFARVGLLESIQQFDPEIGVKFETFSEHRIRGAILNGLEFQTEKQQQLSLSKRVRSKRAERRQVQPDFGLASLKEERAAVFELLTQESVGHAIAWLMENTGCVAPNDREYQEFPYYQALEFKQLSAKIQACISQLSPSEQKVIRYYFFQGILLDEVAETLSLTKGRISQIKRAAIDKLRLSMKASSLDEYVY